MALLQEQADRIQEVSRKEEGRQVQHKLKSVIDRRDKVKQLSKVRREELQIAFLLATFYQNFTEVIQHVTFKNKLTLLYKFKLLIVIYLY